MVHSGSISFLTVVNGNINPQFLLGIDGNYFIKKILNTKSNEIIPGVIGGIPASLKNEIQTEINNFKLFYYNYFLGKLICLFYLYFKVWDSLKMKILILDSKSKS